MLKFSKAYIFILFAVSLLTAYNSTGFYHADEHYQIIEFTGFKYGTHHESDLAWEFQSKMRPAFQVGVAYAVFKVCDTVNITDPYAKSFLLRLLTLLLSWGAVLYFVKCFSKFFKLNSRSKFIILMLTLGLWFLPYLLVRFSSETWSGIFLIIVLALVYKQEKKSTSFLLMGIVAGLSFICRYQMAFALIPIFFYLLPSVYKSKTKLFSCLFGFTLVFILGTLIDYWFYGSFELTSWNYFYINIVEDAASNFGTEGPWYYLEVLLYYPTVPLGIALFVSLIQLLFKQPKNLLMWIALCFVLGHSFVEHKEARFLFPIALLFGPILFLGLKDVLLKLTNRAKFKFVLYTLIGLFIVGNVFGLIVMLSSSAGIGRMALTKYLDLKSKDTKEMVLYHSTFANPFDPWGVPMKFYQVPNLQAYKIDNVEQLNEIKYSNNKSTAEYFAIRKIDKQTEELMAYLHRENFVLVKQSVPSWLIRINYKHGYLPMRDVLFLYKREVIN